MANPKQKQFSSKVYDLQASSKACCSAAQCPHPRPPPKPVAGTDALLHCSSISRYSRLGTPVACIRSR